MTNRKNYPQYDDGFQHRVLFLFGLITLSWVIVIGFVAVLTMVVSKCLG